MFKLNSPTKMVSDFQLLTRKLPMLATL